MGRTIEEIFVSGRTTQEIKDEVLRWFKQNKVEIMENHEDSVKGRWGTGIATAPKYFQVSFKPAQGGVEVHTEGWIGVYGVSEQSFSASALMAGIPRREGWTAMERLWATLRTMSRISAPVSEKEVITREIVLIPCRHCGALMNQIETVCSNCGAHRTL